MAEAKHFRALLQTNRVPDKGVMLVGQQYRVNMSSAQREVLEELGIVIHAFSAKEERTRDVGK
jgi:hypothetical protein